MTMTSLVMVLMVCLTLMAMACLAATSFLIWWVMDSSGKHSISAGAQTTLAIEAMKESTGQQAEVVGMVTKLSELLLLGREMPVTKPLPPSESPPEMPLSSDDIWTGLPPAAREAMIREIEEEATWPSPLEQLHLDSEPATEPTLT